jgi:phage tail-like protein
VQPDEIAALLPAVIARTRSGGAPGDVLSALLMAMSAMHQPCEEVLGRVPSLFDPQVTEDGMVGFLAGWADLDRFARADHDGTPTLPSGLGHLRQLVAVSAELARSRGTKAGLQRFLEVATGVGGFVVRDRSDGVGAAFHLVVELPPDAEPFRDLVREIVDAERPVHLTYELAAPAGPSHWPPGPAGPPAAPSQPPAPSQAPAPTPTGGP